MGFHLTWESDSDAGGKNPAGQVLFPLPPAPLPLLPTFLKQEYPKKKKYIIQSAEASKKVDHCTHSHPREKQAAAAWLVSSSLSPAAGRPGVSGEPGTRPGRSPPARERLLPHRRGCLRPRALPGTLASCP